MSKLNQLDKNRFNETLLRLLKKRLSGKSSSVVSTGESFSRTNPAQECLIGNIGPMRDPNYDGPQPPNAMGMVLLVAPDDDGRVTVNLSGQFDVVHRAIPGIDEVLAELLHDSGRPRPSQPILESFTRATVCFQDVTFSFQVPQDLGTWSYDSTAVANCMQDVNRRLLSNPRIYRNCNLAPNGRPLLTFPWAPNITTQDALNNVIHHIIFAPGADRVLTYHVGLQARVRRPPASLTDLSGAVLLEIYLVNHTPTRDGWAFGINSPFLLDCEITSYLAAGTHHLLPHKLKPEDYRHTDDDGLDGYGITCAVEKIADREFRTNSMPVVPQWDFETPAPAGVGMSREPSFKALATAPLPVLDDLLTALSRYQNDWAAKIKQLEKAGLVDEAQAARNDAQEFGHEVARVRKGRDLLATNADLLQVFKWMNAIMERAIARQGKSFSGWRLFQLGFILTQIEAIAERFDGSDEGPQSWEQADVLWFSTGGGKTEAYLGIICMAMLYQRLKGRNYGTCAWLRFPLRMLSVQQFQRLSYMVAEANRVRQEQKLGGHPFTVGYFTGEGTPNRISSNTERHRKYFLPTLSAAVLEGLKFIKDCPYCDTVDSVRIQRDNQRFRIKHVCSNPECWSNAVADSGIYGEGIRGELGIYVSDEECYRYLPTVLVGTIDKLAVISHNDRFRKFFGSAGFFCPEHGFTQDGPCEHFRLSPGTGGEMAAVPCGNNSRTSTVRTVPIPRLPDPGFSFCIQDELHLLKESLGNFDGHYETLLATLQVLHGGRSPKILAATATIKDYAHHIHHLYQKRATRFPAPGILKGESFYSRAKFTPAGERLVRRYFTTFLPTSMRNPGIKASSIASSRYLDMVDELRELFAADLAQACTLFNLPPAKGPAALAHLETHLNTVLLYVNRKRSISEISRYFEEANAKRGVDRFWIRLDAECTLEEIQQAITHVEQKLPDDPRRELIATNLVSHGVDIERLNCMILAGWPTSTAEYIQSSARAGRVHPGIVVSVLSHLNLFETTVFQNFGDYHTFLDKMVESVPINRFAPKVLERTLPGVMAAVILNWASCQPWGAGIKLGVRDIHRVLNTPGNPARSEIEAAVLRCLSVAHSSVANEFDPRVVADFTTQLNQEVARGLRRLETWSGGEMDMYLSEALGRIYGYGPLRSFRDIENQIGMLPVGREQERVIDALGR